MKLLKDLEELAKKEINEELIEKNKTLLKERILEIRDAKRVLDELEKQYEELLDKPLEQV